MRNKQWFYLVIVAVLLLTACSQAGAPGSGTPAGPTKAADAAPQATSASVATRDPGAKEMACTVVTKDPTPGPTEASMFPPIGKDDWVLGSNPEATMTIIEYSDFM